jgi:6-phosphogluconolactonase
MSMPSTSPPTKAPVLIASSKDSIGSALSHPIIQACKSALSSRDIFTIALSGGSLPNFLRALPTAFDAAGVNPQWNKWHVILADERCVVSTHEDSNLGAVRKHFTDGVAIPKDQVYGIDETLLSEGSEAVAKSYSDNVVKPLLGRSDGMLDCVVLVSVTAFMLQLNRCTISYWYLFTHRVLVQMVTPVHYFPITNF